MGTAAAGVPRGGGGGLCPEPPTPCRPVGLGGVLALGEGLLVAVGLAPGVAPGVVTAGTALDCGGPGAGVTAGEGPYGEGITGLGELMGDGELIGEKVLGT